MKLFSFFIAENISPMSMRNFPPSFWNSQHPSDVYEYPTDPWHPHYPQYHHRSVLPIAVVLYFFYFSFSVSLSLSLSVSVSLCLCLSVSLSAFSISIFSPFYISGIVFFFSRSLMGILYNIARWNIGAVSTSH